MSRKFFHQLWKNRQAPSSSVRKPSKAEMRKRLRRSLAVEPLEDRRLLVVGSFAFGIETGRGSGFDGVLALDIDQDSTTTNNSSECTASLLHTGRHILTAAHCVDFDGDAVADNAARVVFDIDGAPNGNFLLMDIPASDIIVHPNWNNVIKQGNDIVVAELPRVAPAGADRYDIFRGSNELGQSYTTVGYGATGTGTTGQSNNNIGPNGDVRRMGNNRWDSVTDILAGAPLNEPTPPVGTALVSDFDDGTAGRDAMGTFYGLVDRGHVSGDFLEAQGDSGGPGLIGTPGNFRIAGVVSYGVASIFNANLTTDTDPAFRTFGELTVDTRVSAFTSFIDGITEQDYDLVFDMQDQLAGNFDGSDDTIVLQKSGASLQILVNGELAFEEATPERIQSITINGSGDSDHLIIDYPSGVPGGTVNFDGRAGGNSVTFQTGDTNNFVSVLSDAGNPRIDTVGTITTVESHDLQAACV
ncbi:MAG: trypsin-like serine protease [Planctomycetota bacterium]